MEKCNIIKYDETKAIKAPEGTKKFETQNEASMFYHDKVSKNSEVFKDDLKCMHKSWLKAAQAEWSTINKWDISISKNIGVGAIQYLFGGDTFVMPTFTFSYSVDSDVKRLVETIGTVNHNRRRLIKWSCYYENFPFTVSNENIPATGAEEWNVCALIANEECYEHLTELTEWSYTFTCEETIIDDYNDTEKGTTDSYTTYTTYSGNITEYKQFQAFYKEYEKQVYPETPTRAGFIEWAGIVDLYSNYLHDVPHS